MSNQRSIGAWLGLSVLAVVASGAELRAQPHVTPELPLKGSASSIVTFEYDWTDPMFPITTILEGVGTMSHLGLSESRWTHNPPFVLPNYMNGQVVFTAANGDELRGEYGDDPSLTDGYTVSIVGGTGRFEDATGTIGVSIVALEGEWGDDGLPIQPWYAWSDLEGTISYSRASSASAAPEPATIVIMAGAFVSTAFIRRRR